MMTTEEALEYCKQNGFTIYFVKFGNSNIFHINTPRWYAESPQNPYRKPTDTGGQVSFARLVEYVKERIDDEAIKEIKLAKALKRDPTYDEILHCDEILENLSKKKNMVH